MTNLFLKAKHWQLFILMCGIPLIFQFVVMTTIFSTIGQPNINPLFLFQYMKFFPLIMLISVGSYFGWFWSVATGCQNKIPGGIKMKVRKFKVFFFIPLVYIISVLVLVIIGTNGMLESTGKPSISFVLGLTGIIVPMHLFSMFCIFYSVYFTAKTLKTVELQREVKFADFVAEFFLIWFYPVGVWILQPKVNRLAEESPGLI